MLSFDLQDGYHHVGVARDHISGGHLRSPAAVRVGEEGRGVEVPRVARVVAAVQVAVCEPVVGDPVVVDLPGSACRKGERRYDVDLAVGRRRRLGCTRP